MRGGGKGRERALSPLDCNALERLCNGAATPPQRCHNASATLEFERFRSYKTPLRGVPGALQGRCRRVLRVLQRRFLAFYAGLRADWQFAMLQ